MDGLITIAVLSATAGTLVVLLGVVASRNLAARRGIVNAPHSNVANDFGASSKPSVSFSASANTVGGIVSLASSSIPRQAEAAVMGQMETK